MAGGGGGGGGARGAGGEYNVVDGFLKRYPNFRPTVALYPWKCENSVLQYNEVYNGPSTNADGSPYDMDSALKNVVYQFNYSHNNPCGWMLYMGRNTNDIIRYNISDDGGDFIIKYFLTANATPAPPAPPPPPPAGDRPPFMHRISTTMFSTIRVPPPQQHGTIPNAISGISVLSHSAITVSTKPVVSIPSMNHPTTIKSPRILIW